MPNIFLTDAFISRAKCPQHQDQIIYWDHPRTLDGNIRNGSQDGLGLRITKNGKKSLVHAFYLNGRRKRVVIGKSDIGIASARLKIIDRNSQIEDGTNPDATRISQRNKQGITFYDIVSQYYTQHLSRFSKAHKEDFYRLIAPWLRPEKTTNTRRGHNKKKKYNAFGLIYKEYIATEITPTDIGEYINGIKSDHVANSTLKFLKALFNWAIKMQIIDARNPCSPFTTRKVIRRRPEYTPDDIAALAGHIFNPPIEVLESMPEETGLERQTAALARGRIHAQNSQMRELCNFMGILFLTMARPKELKETRFDHFNISRLIWNKHNTKGLKLSKATYEYAYRSVPIHPKVAELVQKQRERWPHSELVFPSQTDQTKPRDNFAKVIKRFKELEGVPSHFQLYDIKRIAISLMLTGQGVRREDVSHYVDHKGNLETTMIYDLGFVDPMRPVAQKLGDLLGL